MRTMATNPLSLRVTLLANNRDHHATMAPGGFTPEIRAEGDALSRHR